MTRTWTARSSSSAVLAVAAAIALAGCGSGPSANSKAGAPTATARPSATTAAELLTKVGAAIKAEDTVRFTKSGANQAGEGAYKIVGSHMDLSMKLSVPNAALKGLELRLVDGTTYMSVPSQTGAGKFFTVNPQNALLRQIIDAMKSIRPSTTFTNLAPAVIRFQDIGQTTIGKDRVEHYELLIDTAKESAASGLHLDIPSSVTDKLPKTYKYSLYITNDYLLRRAEFVLLGQKNTLDYTDWGKKVTISAPLATDIVPAPPGL